MSFFLIGLNLVPRDFPSEKSPEVGGWIGLYGKNGGNPCKAYECLMC